MEEQQEMELRSEEVQELLGTPPHWLVRWGTLLALLSVVALGWLGYLITYPDIVQTKIQVSSVDPLRRLLAEETAFVDAILVNNEDTVEAGEVLLVFKNPANSAHVMALEDRLAAIRSVTDSALLALELPKEYLLGDLKEMTYAYFEKQENLRLLLSGQLQSLSESQIRRRIQQEQQSITAERRQKASVEQRLELAREQLVREQNLLNQRLTTPEKVRQQREVVYGYELAVQTYESNIKNKESEIRILRGEIEGYRSDQVSSVTSASNALRESYEKLVQEVDNWKRRYTLMAPVDGTVILAKDLRANQYVTRDKELAIIVPLRTSDLVGRGVLNIRGSGKVSPGQRAVVKFDSYPFQEFGAVEAVVSWKAKIPTQEGIPIEIQFPQGLLTSTGRRLESTQDMRGSVDITTEEKSLLVWLFERFR